MTLTAEQQVFMLFFAIFWGAVANVQPRWKAFQWPLFFRHRPAKCRVCLSLAVLNVLPLLLFGYVLWVLGECHGSDMGWPILHLVGHGVIPAFALFGCYRLWLAIVEAYPETFYSSKVGGGGVPKEYSHIEPTYRNKPTNSKTQLPIVHLGPNTWFPNAGAAVLYLVLGMVAPWVYR